MPPILRASKAERISLAAKGLNNWTSPTALQTGAFARAIRLSIGVVCLLLSASCVVGQSQSQPTKTPTESTPLPASTQDPASTPRPASQSEAASAKWNQLRVCSGCDLHGMDLSNRDLRGANLSWANLSGANLAGANLSGATLVGADLTNANFRGTQLNKTSLDSTDLTRAVFTSANLKGASLQYSTMTGANFSGADLSDSVFGFRSRGLDGVDFTKATVGCDFPVGAMKKGIKRQRCPTVQAASGPNCPNLPTPPANALYVSASSGTDSSACGTLTSPCATIQQGITNCVSSKCGGVLVDYDEYKPATPISVSAPVSLYGGCLWNSPSQPTYYSKVDAPAGGKPGIIVSNVNSAMTVSAFGVFATKASGVSAPSLAFSISSSSNITLQSMSLTANVGSTGGPGTSGGAGKSGNNANVSAGGTGGCATNTNGGNGAPQMKVTLSKAGSCEMTCQGNNGGWKYGASGNPGTTGASAGGGIWANDPYGGVCYSCPDTERPAAAGNGTPGNAAACGTPGVPSTNTTGSFTGGSWAASQGGTGQKGGDGGGGGGGGSGGYCGYLTCWPACNYDAYYGQAGGGGGAGGCGGTGGTGGQQGGPSIGLLITNSNSGPISILGSTVTAGAGGVGGIGGTGASGGKAGSGASNPGTNICNSTGGSGGTGGTGGAGGSGAGGAGGNGGPAYGIVFSASQAPLQTGVTFYTGTGGTGGIGGPGGTPATSGCQAPPGKAGNPGTAVNVQKF